MVCSLHHNMMYSCLEMELHVTLTQPTGVVIGLFNTIVSSEAIILI